MSITISLPYFGILVVLLLCAPLISALTALGVHRWATRTYRRDMARREKKLNERAVRVLDRERKVSKREEKVHVREIQLGRTAHDVSTQAKLAMTQNDTLISLKSLDDWRI